LINGPDIGIASSAVIALAMTFNELCTNATKFGALSLPGGRIEIAWTIDDETQRLRRHEPPRRGIRHLTPMEHPA
jgi:two-component sensor histidine kinase